MNIHILKTSGNLKENDGLSFHLQGLGSWQVFASDPLDCEYLHTSTTHKAENTFKVTLHSGARQPKNSQTFILCLSLVTVEDSYNNRVLSSPYNLIIYGTIAIVSNVAFLCAV